MGTGKKVTNLPGRQGDDGKAGDNDEDICRGIHAPIIPQMSFSAATGSTLIISQYTCKDTRTDVPLTDYLLIV